MGLDARPCAATMRRHRAVSQILHVRELRAAVRPRRISDAPNIAVGALCTGAIVRLLESRALRRKTYAMFLLRRCSGISCVTEMTWCWSWFTEKPTVKYEAAAVETIFTERDVVMCGSSEI